MKQAFVDVNSIRKLDLPEPDELQIGGHDPVLTGRFKIQEPSSKSDSP